MHKQPKPLKNKEKSTKKERIPLWLDKDMAEWLEKKADEIRVSRCFIMRALILEKMQSELTPKE